MTVKNDLRNILLDVLNFIDVNDQTSYVTDLSHTLLAY